MPDEPPAPAVAARRSQRVFGAVVAILALGGAIAALRFARLWLPPVQLLLDIRDLPAGAELSVSSATGDAPIESSVRPLPTAYELRVTATGEKHPQSAGTEVYFLPPPGTHLLPGRAEPAAMDGGWRPWEHGGRWVATPEPQQPATLVWRDHALGRVTLPLLSHPRGGVARLQLAGGEPVVVDLYAPDEQWRDIELPLPRYTTRLAAVLPLEDEPLAVRATVGGAAITRARVIWGEAVLADWRGALGVDAQWLELPVRGVRTGRIAWLAAGNALLLLARAALHLLVGVLLGLPLVRTLLPHLPYLERWLALVATGLSVPIIASVTLTRLHLGGESAFWATLIAGGVAATIALIFEVRRCGSNLRTLWPSRAEARPLLGVAAMSVVTTLALYSPALALPHWFTGHALTDSYFYINHAEAFRHEPINLLEDPGWRTRANVEHLVAGIYNWAERTGDLLVLLNTALLCGESTRAAYTQLHVNYWLLLPLIGYCLLRRTLTGGAGVWVGALLFSSSGMLYAIFAQCYVAQYVSIPFVLMSVWAAIVLDAHLRRPVSGATLARMLLLAAPLAGTVCQYPAQFLMPLVVAVALLVTAAARRSWRPLLALLSVGALTAALSLAGLIPLVAAPSDVPRYVERLNEIGRTSVFPFYRDWIAFGEIAYGIRDWVGVSHDSGVILRELLGRTEPTWLVQRSNHTGPNLMLICLGVTTVGAACGLRDPARRVVSLTLIVFAAATAALFAAGQTYFAAKLLITCGVLAIPVFALGIDVLFARRAWPLQAIGGGLVAALLWANVTTAWWETSPWLLPERHAGAAERHMSVLDADLRELVELRALRRPSGEPGRIALVGDYAQARGTDRDRVLVGYLSSALARYWVTVNPVDAQWSEPRIEMAIVFAGHELPPDVARRATLIFENAVARVYDLAPQAGER